MAVEVPDAMATALAPRPLLSVVIPVYGSAGSLDELCLRLRESLEKITPHWEIVFVDDCSPDGAWAHLERFAQADSRVRCIQLMRNRGQQRAVLCGLGQSEGDFVVTMDDDLQHRPEEIVRMLEAIESTDVDVVVGRYRARKHGFIRRAGTRAVRWLAERTVGIPPTLSLTSFRIMTRDVAHAAARIRHVNPVVGYLLFSVTPRFLNIDVEHDPRRVGSSNYGIRDLIAYFLCMVMDYSDWPLRAVSSAGVVLSLGSFAAAAFYLYRWMSGTIHVDGFATIVVLITSLFGCVLIGLGIIGSYLVRALRQTGPDSLVTIRTHRNGVGRTA